MQIQVVIPKSRSNEFTNSMVTNPAVDVIGFKVSDLHVKFDLDVPESMVMNLPTWVSVL